MTGKYIVSDSEWGVETVKGSVTGGKGGREMAEKTQKPFFEWVRGKGTERGDSREEYHARNIPKSMQKVEYYIRLFA